MYLAINTGISIKDMQELRYIDVVNIINKRNNKEKEQNATQSDIDMLAG